MLGCWDDVGAAVGITRFLNIAYAMFMYHVSEKGKLRVADRLVTGADKFASGVNSFCPVVADRGAARRVQALRSQCVPGVRELAEGCLASLHPAAFGFDNTRLSTHKVMC